MPSGRSLRFVDSTLCKAEPVEARHGELGGMDSAMTHENRPVRSVVTNYYLVEGRDLARIRIDFETGEAIDAQLLRTGNPWAEHSMFTILADGMEICKSQAKKLAKKLGGRL